MYVCRIEAIHSLKQSDTQVVLPREIPFGEEKKVNLYLANVSIAMGFQKGGLFTVRVTNGEGTDAYDLPPGVSATFPDYEGVRLQLANHTIKQDQIEPIAVDHYIPAREIKRRSYTEGGFLELSKIQLEYLQRQYTLTEIGSLYSVPVSLIIEALVFHDLSVKQEPVEPPQKKKFSRERWDTRREIKRKQRLITTQQQLDTPPYLPIVFEVVDDVTSQEREHYQSIIDAVAEEE